MQHYIKKKCALFSHRVQAVGLLSGALVALLQLLKTHPTDRAAQSRNNHGVTYKCLFHVQHFGCWRKTKRKTSTPMTGKETRPSRGRSCALWLGDTCDTFAASAHTHCTLRVRTGRPRCAVAPGRCCSPATLPSPAAATPIAAGALS